MSDAAKAGFIHIGDKLKIEDIADFQPHQVNKKKAVYARHLGMTKNDSPTINTKGLRIKELYKLNSANFNKKEEFNNEFKDLRVYSLLGLLKILALF